MKWFTTYEIVDIETGEMLNKKHFDKTRYRVIKKEKKYNIINENNGEIRYMWHARSHEQQRMFD